LTDTTGSELPSTLKRFRDGLDGHPVYAAEIRRANRLYETAGDNNQYLGLKKPDPVGISTLDPTASVTAGFIERTERNRDPEPDRSGAGSGAGVDRTMAEPALAPIQIDALREDATSGERRRCGPTGERGSTSGHGQGDGFHSAGQWTRQKAR
jgi:hypothetical protein